MKLKGLKILAGILGVLLIFTLLITLTENKKDRGTFKSDLISLNPSDITRIEIKSILDDRSFSINKINESQWEIESEDNRFNAQAHLVENFLHTISIVKAKQIVSKSKKHWEDYYVSELLGTSIKLYKNNLLSADLVVGRMAFSQGRNPYQQRPDAVTYMRNKGEETVYAVEGMLAMVASQDVNNFRNGEIVKCDPANLTKITFTYPGDSSFILQKENQTWKINGTPADSANTHNYLQSLRSFTSRDFEPLSETEEHVAPAYEVNIEGNNMENIIVKAYPAGDDLFKIISSINDETAFKPDISRFESLFRGKSWFL